MFWFCPICKHTEHHIPAVRDGAARVKWCTRCPRCQTRRKSLRSPIPPGLMTWWNSRRK